MTEIAERLHGELGDLLDMIRRMGGGVVFEEFPGALAENTATHSTQRGLIDEANKVAETIERLRREAHGAGEGRTETPRASWP